MLSKPQKLLLAQLVRDNKEVLLSQFSATVTKKAKQDTWERIRGHLNDVGANIDSLRTLQDVQWANIRRSTMKKITESKKTGAGGLGSLTELDNTVLDILGRDSANVEPVNVADTEVVFGGEIVINTTPHFEDSAVDALPGTAATTTIELPAMDPTDSGVEPTVSISTGSLPSTSTLLPTKPRPSRDRRGKNVHPLLKMTFAICEKRN